MTTTHLSFLYQRLPTELQLKIFEQTLEPRSLKIFDSSLREKFFEQYGDSAPPVALQVCQMLRAHFLPRYPELFQAQNCSPSNLLIRRNTRINSALDTIVVYSSVPETLVNLSCWTSSEDLFKVRHLAIPSLTWQVAVMSHQYPDWRKAMSNFTSLETVTVVSDAIMPRLDEGVDRLKESVERTLLSGLTEDGTLPSVKIIRTGDVCHGSRDGSDRLDVVDFAKADIIYAYMLHFTRPKCCCPICDGPWILRPFIGGFPTLRQILEWRRKSTSRTYIRRPSMFSMFPNDIAVQVRGSTSFINDSALVVPSSMAILTSASFLVTCSLLEKLFSI